MEHDQPLYFDPEAGSLERGGGAASTQHRAGVATGKMISERTGVSRKMSLQGDERNREPSLCVKQRWHRLQATVEECDSDSSADGGRSSSPAGASGPTGTHRPRPGTLTPPSSRDSSPKRGRPSVHFSTRHPAVLHYRAGSPSSSASSPPSSPREDRSHPARANDHDALPPSPPFLSVVDRQWGVLFTEQGEPTRRLGDVLRGLANHMIHDYEPCSSLVISPRKLAAFYARYRLEREPFPLEVLFDAESRHDLANLELLYQDLSCEYHLVADHDDPRVRARPGRRARPATPALTPAGLQTWLTLFIRASPSSESRRLSRLLLDVPLEADLPPSSAGPAPPRSPERLPAQLSRHLLPARRNDRVYAEVASALDDWYLRARSTPPRDRSAMLRDTLEYSAPPPTDYPDRRHRHHGLPRRAEPVVIPSASPASTSRPRNLRQDMFSSSDGTREAHSASASAPGASAPRPRDATTRERPWSSRDKRRPHERHPRHRHARGLSPRADTSPSRTENHRLFQGRGPGKTFGLFWRDKRASI